MIDRVQRATVRVIMAGRINVDKVDMELAASTSSGSENFHPDYPEIQSLV